jgi:hypothetical protein
MKWPFIRRKASVTKIYESVVHGEAFHEGGGFLNDAVVVPNLGAHYGRLQPAGVA